jgi:peroxiredoxin
MRNKVWIVAAAMLLPLAALAQKPSSTLPTPPRETSPETPSQPRLRSSIAGSVFVGERAPDFELDGSNGKAVKLSRQRGDWLVLAFADRKEQVANLREVQADVSSRGARILGVCHEKAGTLRNFARRDSLPFLLVADNTGEISAIYGLYDREHSQTRPGYLIVDRKGTVRMAVLGQILPPQDVARMVQFAMTGL